MLSSSFLSIFTSKLLLPSLSKPLSFLSPFNMDSFLAYFVRGFLHFQVFHVWSALLCLPFFPKTFYILGKYVVLIISSWRPSLKRFSSTPIQLIYIIFLLSPFWPWFAFKNQRILSLRGNRSSRAHKMGFPSHCSRTWSVSYLSVF